MTKCINSKKGFALVEILIGLSIVSIGIIAVISSYITYIKYALANGKNTEASYLLEEGIEALIFLRDKGWQENIAKLSTTTVYYLNFTGSSWATTTTPQYVGGIFLRSFTVSDVFRDMDDNISDAGVYDSGTRKITVSISYYQGKATTTRHITSYIADINN